MKKQNLNLLIFSIAVSIFGLLLDGDVKEPSAVMRFVEFFAMIAIVFSTSFSIYHVLKFAKKRVVKSNF